MYMYECVYMYVHLCIYTSTFLYSSTFEGQRIIMSVLFLKVEFLTGVELTTSGRPAGP